MSRLQLADLDLRASATSPLGDCLIQLNARATPPNEPIERPSSSGIGTWQDRWSSNQDQISCRLQLIETELNRLSADDEAPKLSVFADEG